MYRSIGGALRCKKAELSDHAERQWQDLRRRYDSRNPIRSGRLDENLAATVDGGDRSWIYDCLQPHAAALKVDHPLMLRAIAAAKKKNDRIGASKIADCLRCDFLPERYMASTEIRE